MGKNFGERIRKLRIEKGVLQKDIAIILGTTDNAVGNYERGSRLPDYDTLNKLADYFDVSIDYLLGRTEIKKPIKENSDKKINNNKNLHNADNELLTVIDELSPEEQRELKRYAKYLKTIKTVEESNKESSASSEEKPG